MNTFPTTCDFYCLGADDVYDVYTNIIERELKDDAFFSYIRIECSHYSLFQQAQLLYLWREEFQKLDIINREKYATLRAIPYRPFLEMEYKCINIGKTYRTICEVKTLRMWKTSNGGGDPTPLNKGLVKFYKREEKALRFVILGNKARATATKNKLNDALVDVWDALTDMNENGEEFTCMKPTDGIKMANGGAFQPIMDELAKSIKSVEKGIEKLC